MSIQDRIIAAVEAAVIIVIAGGFLLWPNAEMLTAGEEPATQEEPAEPVAAD
ncbi:hypothetical protein [Mesorhizobium xinjiangense]|uniref:hypothetical protein n=1 Tax=Mesorhizobium xinjiangense TaxID=2678685 RepID=UPI0012EEB954|nr:hypothetical protein [Mesorhizobium xinjiangense]